MRLQLLFACFTIAAAMPASPFPFSFKQPDGMEVQLRSRGNFFRHSLVTEDGHEVARTSQGWMEYVVPMQGSSQRFASGVRVGHGSPPRSPLPHRSNDARKLSPLPPLKPLTPPKPRAQERAKAHGALKNLVVLLKFADHTNRTLPSVEELDILFNSNTAHPKLCPTGSVKMLYESMSYGTFTIQSDVRDWFTVSKPEAYYGDGESGSLKLHEALVEALEAINKPNAFLPYDLDNDTNIDSITFVHSGYGAESGGPDEADRIWSHKWEIETWTSVDGVKVSNYHIYPSLFGRSGSEIARIGVISHETGHFLGLPDLYDTDEFPDLGEGIGSFGMMANAWGFDGSQLYPPEFCSWSKIQLDWIKPVHITPGHHSIRAYPNLGQVFRIDANFPEGEYLLIENRQPLGYDSKLPQGGLAIFHIDEKAGFDRQSWPSRRRFPWPHYRVALLAADGRYDLERGTNAGDDGDLWHADGVDRLGPETLPNSMGYQSGKFINSGIIISSISASAETMSFIYSNPLLEPESERDACIDHLCAEGAICTDIVGSTNTPEGRSCTCADALLNYTEAHGCHDPESEVDACIAHPCAAGGVCKDLVGPANTPEGRACRCEDPLLIYDEASGCAVPTEVDACIDYPCIRPAKCEDRPGPLNSNRGRRCLCSFPQRYTKDGCSVFGDVDACIDFPCAKPARCVDRWGSRNSKRGRRCICPRRRQRYSEEGCTDRRRNTSPQLSTNSRVTAVHAPGVWFSHPVLVMGALAALMGLVWAMLSVLWRPSSVIQP
eukprot:NODE_294_length_2474_cov_104.910098_g273_i0.p1 GENE.NODE_294_length_2474_cov_104.910098_g273_i0~~NODE_294_length_2474_cov_104.910098_g273_i0.p1  ORF type:complete len:794 (-),score=93.40 NODE_294_length_2474_cov_104.910098_g273_i0:91-2418(-)